eukprot:scaffold25153_cov68-Phaeocystis_antarctica.AAC.3
MLARSLLLIVSCEAAITAVTQKSYNTYEIVSSTGNNGITLVDSDGETIASTSAGNTFTVSDATHYNNVNAASQDGTSFSVASWHFQLAQTASCCRAAAVNSKDAASDYQLYTPRMTVAGSQLTVKARSRAPQLVYVKVTATSGAHSGVLLSGDTSETFAGTGPYERTVALPNDFDIITSTLHACGLVSDGIESCTELTATSGVYVYDTPSPPYPPSLPPSPPVSPSQPPTPPKPPPLVVEEDDSVSSAVFGVVVGLLAFLLLLILGLIGGVFAFRRMKGPKQSSETELKQGTTQGAGPDRGQNRDRGLDIEARRRRAVCRPRGIRSELAPPLVMTLMCDVGRAVYVFSVYDVTSKVSPTPWTLRGPP